MAGSAEGRSAASAVFVVGMRPSADPATQAYIDTLLNSKSINAMPQWIKNPQKVWQVYNDFLVKLFTTEASVEALMDEAQAGAEEVVK